MVADPWRNFKFRTAFPKNVYVLSRDFGPCWRIRNWIRFSKSERTPYEIAGSHSTDGWLSLVEGTGFENRRRGNSSGGSNPSPSALIYYLKILILRVSVLRFKNEAVLVCRHDV